MMDLDSAIQHCKEQVQEQAKKGCYSCAEEHQQLAEWLKELKAYREQSGDAISRKYILDLIDTKGANLDDDLLIVEQWIQDAPSVNPHPIECGDAISRQAVLDLIEHYNSDGLGSVFYGYEEGVKFAGAVNKLPSVTPQQRTGRWIQKEEEGEAEPFIIWECSECHCIDEDVKPPYKYCPQCGAKMEVKGWKY